MVEMIARPMIVYGDLNCPFCYALEERLVARKVQRQIDWRLVEHAPELPLEPEQAQDEQLDMLAQELQSLAGRAPDVVVGQPTFRPNSGLAIRAIAEATSIDLRRAWTLRLLLFRALWREGQNIADPGVVAAQVQHAGLPPMRATPEATATALRWTHEWREARFERIPVMISDAGTKLLGLVPPKRLDLFLGTALFSASSELVCDVDDDERR